MLERMPCSSNPKLIGGEKRKKTLFFIDRVQASANIKQTKIVFIEV